MDTVNQVDQNQEALKTEGDPASVESAPNEAPAAPEQVSDVQETKPAEEKTALPASINENANTDNESDQRSPPTAETEGPQEQDGESTSVVIGNDKVDSESGAPATSTDKTEPELENIEKVEKPNKPEKPADDTAEVRMETSTADEKVSSTNPKEEERPKSRSSHRRPSYNTGRNYAGGSYQNYGLTYLPYKSNFEPSEASRRRADEFFKTLKL